MARMLFINGTAHGHLNPTFPLVRELTRRGHEIVYCSSADFQQKIENSGASLLDYGEPLQAFFRSFRPSGDHPFYTLIEFLVRQNDIIAETVVSQVNPREFDCVIHDAMMGGGNRIARQLGLPAICSCTSFAAAGLPVPPSMLARGFHPQLDAVYRMLDQAAGHDNAGHDLMEVFFEREPLNLVYTSRLFQPVSDKFDDSFRFVGPSIDDRRDPADGLPEKTDRPYLYISMGTINNDCSAFYRNCMEAFAGENMTVVLSVGGKVDLSELGNIPENETVRRRVPQLEILKRADVFIGHGGLNSVSEALFFGVPIIAIPQANDQPAVAQRLAELGAGIKLKMAEATPDVLRLSVQQLLSDASYRQACRAISESFRQAGGYQAAADAVEWYLERHPETESIVQPVKTPSP